jgi:opacity protein-like surface antigen
MTDTLKHALTAVCVIAMTTSAVAEDWQWSLGVSYRTFNDVDFSDYKVRSTATTSGDVDAYVNGVNPAPGIVSVVDGPAQNGGLPTVVMDQINVNDASDDLDDGYGLTFELRKITPEPGEWSSGLSLSLGYIAGDLNETMAGDVTTDSFTVVGDFDPTYTVLQPSPAQQDSPIGALTTGTVEFDVEVDALVLSGGYLGMYQGDSFAFTFGIGPSITFADARTEAKPTVTWNGAAPPGLAGTPIAQQSHEDDETDLLFGLYASLGVEVNLSDNARLGIEYRYDFVADDIDTDIADIDLSGQSLSLKLIFSF